MTYFLKYKRWPVWVLFLQVFLLPLFTQEVLPSSTTGAELALSTIFGEAAPVSPYAERLRLIHRLPSDLAPEQLERCRAFLESPLAGQPLPDLEFNALKNELVFALLRQRDGLHAKVAETSPVGQKTVADLAQGVLAGDLRVEAGQELPPGAEVPAVAVGPGTFDGFFETMSGDELEKLRKDAIVLHGSRIRLWN